MPAPLTRRFWTPLLVCVALTPVCFVLGLASAGSGHGDYVLAKLLFPYAMFVLSTTPALSIALAIVQYPIYGLFLGLANREGRRLSTLGLMLGIHVVLAGSCLLTEP